MLIASQLLKRLRQRPLRSTLTDDQRSWKNIELLAGSASLALGAFAWSALVEAAQLSTSPWLQDLRSTTAGALLLGQGFQWADLAAYGVGAVVIGVWDARARAARRRREVF